ncbi:MAG: DUF6320 domain-containing protein [Clostridia bacterium]
MKIEINYPITNSKKYVLYHARKISLYIMTLAVIVCGIVNLAVGGTPWFFYVLGGVVLFWRIFLHWGILDNTIMQKFWDISVTTCVYLIIVFWITGGTWLYDVLPIVAFSMFIVLNALYYLDYRNKRQNIMPLIWLVILSLIYIVVALCIKVEFGWEMIVLSSITGATVIASAIFYRQPIKNELIKRFHVR